VNWKRTVALISPAGIAQPDVGFYGCSDDVGKITVVLTPAVGGTDSRPVRKWDGADFTIGW
jgi:hypothetical protein